MRSNGLKLSRVPGEVSWLGNLSGLGAGSGRGRGVCGPPSRGPDGTRRAALPLGEASGLAGPSVDQLEAVSLKRQLPSPSAPGPPIPWAIRPAAPPPTRGEL